MSQNKKRQIKEDSKNPPVKPKRNAVNNQNRRTAIIMAGVVVVLILAIVGVIGYPTYVAPYRRTIITVDNITIRMDYFLKRIELTGSDPIAEITNLTNDQIIKLGAPKLPIAAVTANDIDQTLKSIFEGQTGNTPANGGNITASDLNSFTPAKEAEFKEWYRQLLNNSGLTDAQYKDIITIEILRTRLQEYLASIMPTSAEQAHVYLIIVETEKQATEARARWAAGENFTALAKELSVDTTTAENGGELGWFPKGGVLIPSLEEAAFSLTTGNVSEPLPVVQDEPQADGSTQPTVVGYDLVLVTERSNRELDDNALQTLQGQVVDKWLSIERTKYNIKWYGLGDAGFDSETYAWIKYQMAKNNPPAPASTANSGQQGP